MPPQGVVLAAALGWNWQRSLTGKTTISQLARRHRREAIAIWLGLTVWVIPHWLHD